MITIRAELICHDIRAQRAHPSFLRWHKGRNPRELYTLSDFRVWFRTVLPTLRSTQYATAESPLIEASTILSRFAAGARLNMEPDEQTPGDIKRLDHSIWELKTGDVRIFGWFHDHDCFVAASGDDASYTKANGLYRHHIQHALDFMALSGLSAKQGDHVHVLTL